MRLLNTKDLTFGEFFGSEVPTYCILSHRWGDDETTYSDILHRRWKPSTQGYNKVYGSCRLASRRGFEWIWIDTCCIDKTNNVELTEAINSMFNYYSNAKLCIAYLNDVSWQDSEDEETLSRRCMDRFRKTAWFTRGWTLQELLAPARLEFFDYNFKDIGSKSSLHGVISRVTGIASDYLRGRKKINEASIATRMSWAAERVTSRLEDRAYSLLGIFGVSMPLLYGEGKMAFFRLQQQIIEYSMDESIYAWTNEDAHDDQPFGMLAESPRDFLHSGTVQMTDTSGQEPPFSWKSGGIVFERLFHRLMKEEIVREGAIFLACKRPLDPHSRSRICTVAVWLRQIKGTWYRIHCRTFCHPDVLFGTGNRSFYVPQPNLTTTPRLQYESPGEVLAMVLNERENDLREQRNQRRKAREALKERKKEERNQRREEREQAAERDRSMRSLKFKAFGVPAAIAGFCYISHAFRRDTKNMKIKAKEAELGAVKREMRGLSLLDPRRRGLEEREGSIEDALIDLGHYDFLHR